MSDVTKQPHVLVNAQGNPVNDEEARDVLNLSMYTEDSPRAAAAAAAEKRAATFAAAPAGSEESMDQDESAMDTMVQDKNQDQGDAIQQKTEPELEDVKATIVKLAIKYYDRDPINITTKSTIKFGKLMDAYAAKTSRDVSLMRFIFDGERLDNRRNETLYDIGLEDGDEIDVFDEQIGGSLE
jgi:hypothetical protein